jgi:hypothetical protein
MIEILMLLKENGKKLEKKQRKLLLKRRNESEITSLIITMIEKLIKLFKQT